MKTYSHWFPFPLSLQRLQHKIIALYPLVLIVCGSLTKSLFASDRPNNHLMVSCILQNMYILTNSCYFSLVPKQKHSIHITYIYIYIIYIHIYIYIIAGKKSASWQLVAVDKEPKTTKSGRRKSAKNAKSKKKFASTTIVFFFCCCY